jgi:hypothetical protein
MAEAIQVKIADLASRQLVAGPLFFTILPQRGEVLKVDGCAYHVMLVERDYSAGDATVYAHVLGDETHYQNQLQDLATR